MFERFTDRARRVLVLAQEEARLLNHSFIGTEHLLLGLIHEGEGVAAKALESLGISLEAVRERVEETIGPAGSGAKGPVPFSPRAKKVLELSLREALQLGHNYIGTEHILLGLVREGEGVAAQVLRSLGADLGHVRETVTSLLSRYGPPGAAPLFFGSESIPLRPFPERRRFATRVLRGPEEMLVDERVEFQVTGVLLDERGISNPDHVEVLWLIRGVPQPLIEVLSHPAHAPLRDLNQRSGARGPSRAVPTSHAATSWRREHSILNLSDDTEASYRLLFEETDLRKNGEIAGCSLFHRVSELTLDSAKSLEVEWRGQTIEIGLE